MTRKIQHICSKEAEISETHTIVKRLDKAIMGNGRPGMLEEWTSYKGYIKAIVAIGSVTAAVLAISISIVALFF